MKAWLSAVLLPVLLTGLWLAGEVASQTRAFVFALCVLVAAIALYTVAWLRRPHDGA